MALKNKNTSNENLMVEIYEVDTENQEVQVRTSDGIITLQYGVAAGIISVPKVGEFWSISRNGYNWDFTTKVDLNKEGVIGLAQGDTRVSAATSLHLDATTVKMNGQTLGVIGSDRFTAPIEGLSSVTLTYQPISIESVQVFNNGLLIDPMTLNLSSKILTTSPRLSYGVVVVYYQYIP